MMGIEELTENIKKTNELLEKLNNSIQELLEKFSIFG